MSRNTHFIINVIVIFIFFFHARQMKSCSVLWFTVLQSVCLICCSCCWMHTHISFPFNASIYIYDYFELCINNATHYIIIIVQIRIPFFLFFFLSEIFFCAQYCWALNKNILHFRFSTDTGDLAGIREWRKEVWN